LTQALSGEMLFKYFPLNQDVLQKTHGIVAKIVACTGAN
jgi:hypothetical protein